MDIEKGCKEIENLFYDRHLNISLFISVVRIKISNHITSFVSTDILLTTFAQVQHLTVTGFLRITSGSNSVAIVNSVTVVGINHVRNWGGSAGHADQIFAERKEMKTRFFGNGIFHSHQY